MRFFFDEDVGTGVPQALRRVGISCEWVAKRFRNKGGVGRGTPDELWIPYAGRRGMLVFSCNKAILETEAQLDLWLKHEVGGVFLTTGQERKDDVLLLILKRMAWFKEIHESSTRPFAFTTTIHGKWRQVKLD